MSKTKQKVLTVLKAGPGFHPGHERLGGRKKRTAAQARALAEELGIDPMSYLLHLLAVDVTEELEIKPDGTEQRVKVPVSRELKVSISQGLMNFFYPRLNTTAVTGPDEGPVLLASQNQNMSVIMSSPEAVEMAQRLALRMAESKTPPDPQAAPWKIGSAEGQPPDTE